MEMSKVFLVCIRIAEADCKLPRASRASKFMGICE